jgi:hypothetical protein
MDRNRQVAQFLQLSGLRQAVRGGMGRLTGMQRQRQAGVVGSAWRWQAAQAESGAHGG